MITIVVADDQGIVRQGVRALLESDAEFSVVAEAADGIEALELVEKLKPTVLVTDAMMPGLTGMEVTRQAKQRSPNTRVLIVSMYSEEAYVLEALKNGADGYVLKNETMPALLEAVHVVLNGKRYLSPPLTEKAIEAYISKAYAAMSDDYDTLTNREHEVMQLAAEGHSSSAIAARLSISQRTAETHRTNIMRKLGLHNQVDLIRYAVRRGLII